MKKIIVLSLVLLCYRTISTIDNELTLWQHNIQQRPSTEGLKHQLTGQHTKRSRLSTVVLPDAIRAFDPAIDVVTVNEAFTRSLRPELVSNIQKNGFPYATNVLNSNTSRLWSGGVMVFSKYPIVAQKDYQYKEAAGNDAQAAKGVQYVKIMKGQKPYHIFATHTNASYTFGNKKRLPLNDAGRIVRRKQFQELKQFINQQNIPANEPIIIVGDLNLDMVSEQGQTNSEYTDMLTKLNATHVMPSGHRYTLDKNSNELVDPHDGPPQHLDYVLYTRDHQQPTASSAEIVCLKSNGKNVCQKDTVPHLSDHYPIRARFKF